MSLAGNALLNAGLLLSTLGVTAAAAAALAQGILGFVQKARHIFGVCEVGFGLLWCDEDWMEEQKLRGAGQSYVICPGELRLRVRCLRDSLIDLDHVRDVIVALRPGLVVTVGQSSHFLGRKWDVAGFLEGQVRLCLALFGLGSLVQLIGMN